MDNVPEELIIGVYRGSEKPKSIFLRPKQLFLQASAVLGC